MNKIFAKSQGNEDTKSGDAKPDIIVFIKQYLWHLFTYMK